MLRIGEVIHRHGTLLHLTVTYLQVEQRGYFMRYNEDQK